MNVPFQKFAQLREIEQVWAPKLMIVTDPSSETALLGRIYVGPTRAGARSSVASDTSIPRSFPAERKGQTRKRVCYISQQSELLRCL